VRIFFVHHVTWSVNSICHFLGSRRFNTDDHSTNVFWLALPDPSAMVVAAPPSLGQKLICPNQLSQCVSLWQTLPKGNSELWMERN
jgi:hypothetical protein